MKNIIWMAWRNLVSRSGMGLSFMTCISITGVAIGVGTLILVLSVMGGFEQSLKAKMLKGEPHLEVHAKNVHAGFSLNKYPLEGFESLISQGESFAAFTKADVVLKHRKHLQAANLLGLDPKGDHGNWVFSESLIEGSMADLQKSHTPILSSKKSSQNKAHKLPAIIMGLDLANNLGVDIGDEVTIVNPNAAIDSEVATSGGTVSRQYVLTGIFSTGIVAYDAKMAVVPIGEGRRFMVDYDVSLDQDNYVSGVGVRLKDPLSVAEIARNVEKATDLKTLTWIDSNASLLFALKLEKFAMGSILMLIVLVAAFSISGTLMMTVFHKRRQISILRALGLEKQKVLFLYLSHGFLIGTLGVCIGLVFGLSGCLMIDKVIIHLPPEVYYNAKLPVNYIPSTYFVICGGAWILTMVGAVYPAMTASRQDPSLGLRFL